MTKREWSFNLSKYKIKNLQDPIGYKINTDNITLRVQTKQGFLSIYSLYQNYQWLI